MALVLDLDGLRALVATLLTDGYEAYAPVVRDGALAIGRIDSLDDLPRGVTDEQDAGTYRLRQDGSALFGYASPATSWKSVLFPARRAVWRADDDGVPVAAEPDRTRRALIGVRSCDLQAIETQDRVLIDRTFADDDYAARRSNVFIVAVTCGSPASTCFCVSMGSGPAPTAGYDISLTELIYDAGHRFVAEPGSAAGMAVLDRIPGREAAETEREGVACVVAGAVAQMRRQVDTHDIRNLLYDNAEHERWDDVASRCLACANCTLVCPTCFCVTTEDVHDLTRPLGQDRVWDSCFHPGHSYLHGGPVRETTRARYRQWLTHKFASWIDQFGSSGCVGCGRCIAWCPAGIDVTEELAAIRATAPGEEDGS